jgi:hypothetical protein
MRRTRSLAEVQEFFALIDSMNEAPHETACAGNVNRGVLCCLVAGRSIVCTLSSCPPVADRSSFADGGRGVGRSGSLLASMDVLAYSRGPGAFTGVRIAAAAVQAMAFARDLPVLPVSSLAKPGTGAWRVHGAHVCYLYLMHAWMRCISAAMRLDGADATVGYEHLCAPGPCRRSLHGIFFAAGNGAGVYESLLRAQ